MKLQYIAAAVALATGMGAANAAIDFTQGQTNGSGNGNLSLIAFDNTGGTTTAGIFDLGLTLNDFVGATGNGTAMGVGSLAATAGSSIVWDFNANTITINGTLSTAFGGNDWTAAWNRLLANVDMADLQFVVTAFDNTGFGAAKRVLVTGDQTQTDAALLAQNNSLFATAMQPGSSNNIFTPVSTKGTIASADNGAYTFTAEDGATTRQNGYVMAGDGFANNWRNGVVLAGNEAFANTTTGLWLLDGTGRESLAAEGIKLDVAGAKLVYGTVAVVPEPTTYALAIAGLAIVGTIARRRKA